MAWLIYIVVMIGLTAVVSFLMALIIRANWLSSMVSALVAESLVILYGLHVAAQARYPDAALLGVNVTLIFFTPVFIGAAVGFTMLARYFYRGFSDKPKP